MFDDDSSKYVFFTLILIVGVAADQVTKWYASERLATTRPGVIEHPITVEVPGDAEPMSLREYLGREFSWSQKETLEAIARAHVRTPKGKRLGPSSQVQPGQKIVVENRTVTVLEDYWEFEYTVNPGAAFGLLSESGSAYRLPFFIVVSLLAILVILYLLKGVHFTQRLLIASLSMIGTGAIGNFIDRLRFGHVVDFIVWKYTDAYRWPTFNIADALISVGVVLMLFEIFRGNGEFDEKPPDSSPEESAESEQ